MRFLLVEDKQITISDKDYENVKKFLDQNNIKYNNKDISYDRNEISDNRTYSLRDGERVLKILSKKNPNITSQYLNVLRSITPNHSHYKNYMNYLNNLKVKLNGQETIETIFKLKLNDKLTGQENWLNDPSLYSETDKDNATKIKVLAFINDPATKSKYIGTPPTVAWFKDKNKNFIDAEHFKQKLREWENRSGRKEEEIRTKEEQEKQAQAEQEKQEKELAKAKEEQEKKRQQEIENQAPATPETGGNILKRALNKQNLDAKSVRDYVKKLIPENDGLIEPLQSSIEAGDLDDTIDEILGKKYSSSMGRNKIDLLNQALLKAAKSSLRIGGNK